MTILRWVIYAPLFLSLCSCQPQVRVHDVTPPTVYHRVEDNSGKLTLETAHLTVRLKDQRMVSLIAVVHMADRSYYEALDKELQRYDLVLYEFLGKEENSILPPYPKSRRDDVLFRRLGLFYQTACMDYSSDRFLHADLTATELAPYLPLEPMALQDDLFQLLAKPLSSSERRQNLMLNLENFTSLLGGERHNEVLSKARHKALWDQLHSEQASHAKNVAILYGSFHMPAIYKMLPVQTVLSLHWNKAWQSLEEQKEASSSD